VSQTIHNFRLSASFATGKAYYSYCHRSVEAKDAKKAVGGFVRIIVEGLDSDKTK